MSRAGLGHRLLPLAAGPRRSHTHSEMPPGQRIHGVHPAESRMVREGGLEPPRPRAAGPKPAASAIPPLPRGFQGSEDWHHGGIAVLRSVDRRSPCAVGPVQMCLVGSAKFGGMGVGDVQNGQQGSRGRPASFVRRSPCRQVRQPRCRQPDPHGRSPGGRLVHAPVHPRTTGRRQQMTTTEAPGIAATTDTASTADTPSTAVADGVVNVAGGGSGSDDLSADNAGAGPADGPSDSGGPPAGAVDSEVDQGVGAGASRRHLAAANAPGGGHPTASGAMASGAAAAGLAARTVSRLGRSGPRHAAQRALLERNPIGR